jgi:hypothetical protein
MHTLKMMIATAALLSGLAVALIYRTSTAN